MQHFIISVLHSSHSAGLWERRRDFDTKLWQTVRLRPDSHINGLQLHWLRHQQLHPAGCCAQGLSHYQWRNALSTDKLANKQASTVGIDVWLPRCKLVAEYPSFFFYINIFSAQSDYYTSWLCVGCWVSGLDSVMFSVVGVSAVNGGVFFLFFFGALNFKHPFDLPPECPVTHEGPQWGHSSCKRRS